MGTGSEMHEGHTTNFDEGVGIEIEPLRLTVPELHLGDIPELHLGDIPELVLDLDDLDLDAVLASVDWESVCKFG